MVPAENAGWSFETMLKLLDERFAGSDRYHQKIIEETDKRHEQRFMAHQEALQVAFSTARDALAEAKLASNVGFEKSNEWRASLNDVMATRISRDEFTTQHSALSEKVDLLSARLDRYEGRSGGVGASWRDALAILSTLAAIAAVLVVIFFRH